MRQGQVVIAGALLLALTACTDTRHVLFVTDSSLGINVDGKPPTASVAYDRTEGYIAPIYPNGAAPPVVGSMAVGGNIFAPKIRQVYATGAAAQRVANANCSTDPNPPPPAPACTAQGPDQLEGTPAKDGLGFFGTSTTLGFKVGFSTSQVPDSFVLGYKRKEFSFLPLGTAKAADGQSRDVYPSVIASIDANTNAASLQGTGLTSQQFIATGTAADELASTRQMQTTFGLLAANATTDALTTEQRAEILGRAKADLNAENSNLDKIAAYLTAGGKFCSPRLAALVTTANATNKVRIDQEIGKIADTDTLRQQIGSNQTVTGALAAAIPAGGAGDAACPNP